MQLVVEAEFPDEDWHSVDDCYDGHWDAGTSSSIDTERESYNTRSCY